MITLIIKRQLKYHKSQPSEFHEISAKSNIPQIKLYMCLKLSGAAAPLHFCRRIILHPPLKPENKICRSIFNFGKSFVVTNIFYWAHETGDIQQPVYNDLRLSYIYIKYTSMGILVDFILILLLLFNIYGDSEHEIYVASSMAIIIGICCHEN